MTFSVVPLYQLLGGKVRDSVPLYAHAGGPTKDACVESAQGWMEQGFRHVRGQLGSYGGGGFIPPAEGSRPESGYQGRHSTKSCISRRFEHLRNKLGWEVKLLHDVHEHPTPTAALQLARRMEPVRMFFAEDILPPEQIEHFRTIRAQTDTPMAMGQLFTHPLEWARR